MQSKLARQAISIFFLITLSFGCSSIVGTKPYVSVQDNPRVKVNLRTNRGELLFQVFSFDAQCNKEFQGRVLFTDNDPQPSIYLRPGRAYFALANIMRNVVLRGQGVSMILVEGQEYTIEFKALGSSTTWEGTKLEYEYNYLNVSGEFPQPVEVDHMDVCGRK